MRPSSVYQKFIRHCLHEMAFPTTFFTRQKKKKLSENNTYRRNNIYCCHQHFLSFFSLPPSIYKYLIKCFMNVIYCRSINNLSTIPVRIKDKSEHWQYKSVPVHLYQFKLSIKMCTDSVCPLWRSITGSDGERLDFPHGKKKCSLLFFRFYFDQDSWQLPSAVQTAQNTMCHVKHSPF